MFEYQGLVRRMWREVAKRLFGLRERSADPSGQALFDLGLERRGVDRTGALPEDRPVLGVDDRVRLPQEPVPALDLLVRVGHARIRPAVFADERGSGRRLVRDV